MPGLEARLRLCIAKPAARCAGLNIKGTTRCHQLGFHSNSFIVQQTAPYKVAMRMRISLARRGMGGAKIIHVAVITRLSPDLFFSSPAYESWTMAKLGGYMVPELRREREASSLNLPELTEFIDGGEIITEKRKEVCKSSFLIDTSQFIRHNLISPDQLVVNDPVFRLDDKYFLDGEEAFDRAMQKSVHYVKKAKELKLDPLEKNIMKK